MTDIVMPRLSDSMEEGTVLQWMKSVGEQVALGEELVEIETDKANMVFEADAAGTLIEILAQEGETRPIGEVIARVGDRAEAAPAAEAPARAAEDGAAEPAPEPTPEPAPAAPARPRSPTGADGRLKASPLARRIAAQRGVELSALSGSGPGGRIIKADVEAAGEPAPAPAPGAGRAGRRAALAGDRQGRGRGDRADPNPAHDRQADGRVQGDRAALLPAVTDRHEPL